MVIPPDCAITHRQILTGACPRCGAEVNVAGLSPGGGIEPSPELKWNVTRMEDDVVSGDELTRVITLKNLCERPPGAAAAIPILRLAMADPLKNVRDAALRAIWEVSRALDPSSVKQFEVAIARDLSDLATLALVLVVYFRCCAESTSVRHARQQLILRTIEHLPRAEIARCAPLLRLVPEFDAVPYDEARQLWLRNVDANPYDAELLAGAAAFFSGSERSLSVDLLRRCEHLEPHNPEWSSALGRMYSLESKRQPAGSRANRSAAPAIAQFERAIAQTVNDEDRFGLVLSAARAAYIAGDYEKSTRWSMELVRLGAIQKKTVVRAVAIHEANVVLGHLALIDGNLEEAKDRLMSAVSVPDFPARLLFTGGGKNLSLAKELLEQGERDSVLGYLRKCAECSPQDAAVFHRWISDIECGRARDFRASPAY